LGFGVEGLGVGDAAVADPTVFFGEVDDLATEDGIPYPGDETAELIVSLPALLPPTRLVVPVAVAPTLAAA
jgi:hypothetical protein